MLLHGIIIVPFYLMLTYIMPDRDMIQTCLFALSMVLFLTTQKFLSVEMMFLFLLFSTLLVELYSLPFQVNNFYFIKIEAYFIKNALYLLMLLYNAIDIQACREKLL